MIMVPHTKHQTENILNSRGVNFTFVDEFPVCDGHVTIYNSDSSRTINPVWCGQDKVVAILLDERHFNQISPIRVIDSYSVNLMHGAFQKANGIRVRCVVSNI